MTRKFVITGAPGTGKTTIINYLKDLEYKCHEEISRKIISDQISSKGNILPWENLSKFSKKVFDLRKIQLLESKEDISFFDRGIVDVYAYMKENQLNIPKNYCSDCVKYRYNTKVFYTPIWEEIYHNDEHRKETLSKARLIEKHIIKSYKEFKYNLIRVPRKNVNERVLFILSKI